MIDERALIVDIESGMDAIDQWMQVWKYEIINKNNSSARLH